MAVLGDVFLRNFYIVFDQAVPQIALAHANTDARGSAELEPIVSRHIPRSVLAPGVSGLNSIAHRFGKLQILLERGANHMRSSGAKLATALAATAHKAASFTGWVLAKREELIGKTPAKR
jgi:hypothetical protein